MQIPRLRIICSCLFVLSALAPVNAQAPGAPPDFDLVAIHPAAPDDSTPERITNSPRNGSFVAVNVPVKSLLEVAYDLPDTRMSGGPAWLSSQRFYLKAKSDAEVDSKLAALPTNESRQIKREMLKALLAERFHMAVHREMRDMPVYLLTAAPGQTVAGNAAEKSSPTEGTDAIHVPAGQDSLAILAYELSWRLGRPVLDRTGLRLNRALSLQWRDDAEASANTDAPPLSSALAQQLGLTLKSSRAPVEVLIVDHAEKPASEN